MQYLLLQKLFKKHHKVVLVGVVIYHVMVIVMVAVLIVAPHVKVDAQAAVITLAEPVVMVAMVGAKTVVEEPRIIDNNA